MRAIKIDAKTRTITEFDADAGGDRLTTMQKIVGGYIEPAHEFPNGDTVYVNEEGLLEGIEDFIIIDGAHQPFAGNAVIVGAEVGEKNTPAKTSIDDLTKIVKFTTRTALRNLHTMRDGPIN